MHAGEIHTIIIWAIIIKVGEIRAEKYNKT